MLRAAQRVGQAQPLPVPSLVLVALPMTMLRVAFQTRERPGEEDFAYVAGTDGGKSWSASSRPVSRTLLLVPRAPVPAPRREAVERKHEQEGGRLRQLDFLARLV